MMQLHEDDIQLPREIREGLAALYQPARGMDQDAAVLAAARRAGEEARIWRYWRRAGAVGIAAAVALTAGILWQHNGKATAYARTGDIRDAYYLARQIKAQGGQTVSIPGPWDVNKDGVVDVRDVRTLAFAAVKVEGRVIGAAEGTEPSGTKGVTP